MTCEVCNACKVENDQHNFSHPFSSVYCCRWCDVKMGFNKLFVERTAYQYNSECGYCKEVTEVRAKDLCKHVAMCPGCWQKFNA